MIFVLILTTFLYSALSGWRGVLSLFVALLFICIVVGMTAYMFMPDRDVARDMLIITLGVILPLAAAAFLGQVARLVAFVLLSYWLQRK